MLNKITLAKDQECCICFGTERTFKAYFDGNDLPVTACWKHLGQMVSNRIKKNLQDEQNDTTSESKAKPKTAQPSPITTPSVSKKSEE